jgi:uncharacterized protein (TIGR02996 family)
VRNWTVRKGEWTVMHDDSPFLCAIREAPFDDGPRLVYADRLDERGECARAEFIRVQCELARLALKRSCQKSCAGCRPRPEGIKHPHEPKICARGRRLIALRRREQELLTDLNWLDWAPSILLSISGCYWPVLDGPTDWEYRRGFVASVTLTTEQFLGGPCGRCGGTGDVAPPAMRRHQLGGSRRAPGTRCPDCHDTGHVEGLAAALFAAAPVTEVRLSDRGPDAISDGRLAWWYTDPDWHRPGLYQHHWLPVELRPYLTGRICEPIDEPRPGVCGFDYGDSFAGTDGVGLARADLSAACVALGRDRAELPALARLVSPNFLR